MSAPPPPLPGLAELADRYGVQSSFVGTDGRVHRAEDAVIVAILAALGAPIAPGSDGAAGAAGVLDLAPKGEAGEDQGQN